MNFRVSTASRLAVRTKKDEMEMNVEMKNIDRSMKSTGIPRTITKKKILTTIEFLEVSKRLNREKKKWVLKSNNARDVEKLSFLSNDDFDLIIFLSSSKFEIKRLFKHDMKIDTKRKFEIKFYKYVEENIFVNDEKSAVSKSMSNAKRLKFFKRIKKKKIKKNVLKFENASSKISSSTRSTVLEFVKNAIMKNFKTKSTSTTILKSLLIIKISKVAQTCRKLNKAVRKKKVRIAKKLKKIEKKKIQKSIELLKTSLNLSTSVLKKSSRIMLKKFSRMKLKKNKSRNARSIKKNKSIFKKIMFFNQIMRDKT